MSATTHVHRFDVEPRHTAHVLGNEGVMVLGTPFLLLFMELTSQYLVEKLEGVGTVSVGISADFKHLAASMVGSKIIVTSVLIEQDRKRYAFEVRAEDQYILTAGRKNPSRTALEVIFAPGEIAERWTYAALIDAVEASAGGLRAKGLKPGHFLLLRLGNTSDFPILFLAAIRAGIIPVPSSTALTTTEVARQIDVLGGDGMIASDETTTLPSNWPQLSGETIKDLRSAAPLEPVESYRDDLAYIIFTSGTGAKPKAVAHAQRAIWARRMMWDGWYGLREDDRMLHAGAFNWTYTLGTGLMDPWSRGATALVYAGEHSRDIWPALAAKHAPTLFAAAPGVYRQMLNAPELSTGFHTLRHGLSAGETLPQNVRDTWCAATGKPIYEALGMSEISTFISSNPNTPHKPGTAGKPQTGRRIAILDDQTFTPLPANSAGQLAIHRDDPGMMLGYHNAPDLTQAQFKGDWFVTGDSAMADDEGYISHLGRSDDVLNAGGYRVSPLEIEALINTHAQITECAAVELPVKADASIITVFFVASSRPFDPNPLETLCEAELAAYKRPRAFRQIDALPRTPNGKLRRRTLVETYGWRADP